ncbi:MAG: helicase, partial [Clostridia bacterium]|nr:helicase [Clostridia bacterium]
NSGKTHDALEALMKAESGMYLGPLRLLALEVFDRLNGAGVPCNLLTGEEEETVPGARITASTIELCDYSKRYDVVVIDEAQMIADRSRGSHWTKAILTVNAREIHVCMAPMAKDLLLKLVGAIPAPYAVHEHERLVPLVFSGYWRKLSDIEEGDAVIAFSRNQVLNIAAHLESVHMPASVIYGSLAPAARREEVRRFASKETKVAVATDAIGMGISLPIKRILFSQTSKFDGERTRSLKPWEIQQIAGRAGRFGMYDLGEVLTLEDSHLVRTGREVVRTGMEAEISQITRLVLPFPREALGSGFSLMELLTGWNMLGQGDLFVREDLSEARTLLSHLGGRFDKDVRDRPDLVYDLITCPVDTKNSELVYYWKTCAAGILRDRGIPYPNYSLETLESCERQYHALDIYYQLSRRIGLRASVQEEKEKVCARIHEFLKTDKQLYLRRCSYCGKKLPWDFPFGMCEKCYAIGWGDFQGGW